jgi:hypothetical protein
MSLSGDDADKFEVSSNNLIAFKTAPNYEVPTDADTNNVYKVTLTATTDSTSTSLNIEITVTNAVEESDKPVLSTVTFSTTSVDVSSESKDIVVTLRVEDESGVDNNQDFPGLYGNGFSADSITGSRWTLKSGDNKDGIWESTITVPQGQASGEYYFYSGPFKDVNGISHACYTNYSIELDLSCGTRQFLTVENIDNSSSIYYLYGGSDQSDYLGCYGCANTASDSVCNSVGTYGSNVSSSSIWNTVGSYGSTVGTYSPWNSVSTSPPEFFNQDKTTTYGKFTVNTATANRTTVTKLTNIIDYFNNNSSDIAATREYACEQTQSAAAINSLSSNKPNLNLSNKVIFD